MRDIVPFRQKNSKDNNQKYYMNRKTRSKAVHKQSEYKEQLRHSGISHEPAHRSKLKKGHKLSKFYKKRVSCHGIVITHPGKATSNMLIENIIVESDTKIDHGWIAIDAIQWHKICRIKRGNTIYFSAIVQQYYDKSKNPKLGFVDLILEPRPELLSV